MITFVIFHIDVSDAAIKSSEILPAFHNQDQNYSHLLELAFRSALLFHPTCQFVLLTDETTQISFSPQISERLQTRREAVNKAEMMFSRTIAELKFIEQHDYESHIVFMDSDMLINGRLDDLFNREFDVALSYSQNQSESKKMPINGGLAIIHQNSRERALQFFQRVHDLYTAEHLEKFRLWWGDQYALIEAIGRDNFFKRESDLLLVDGVSIQLLPCQTYNYAPKKKINSIAWELKSKKIIHFKGERKKFMAVYWETFLVWRESPTMGARLKTTQARLKLLKRALIDKR